MTAEPLRRFIAQEAIAPKDFGDLVHIPASTIRTWISRDSMPRYVMVLLEGLQRRQRQTENHAETLVLIGTEQELKPIETIAAKMGITVARLQRA